MRINLNDPVKVKLTDYGISIYYHRFDVINYKAGRTVCEPSYPKVDKDGYTEFQLWDFMNIYGSYLKMGEPNVICPLEIIFQEKERDNKLVSIRDVELALLEKGQHSKRYRLGETWELNFHEIREALETLAQSNEEKE